MPRRAALTSVPMGNPKSPFGQPSPGLEHYMKKINELEQRHKKGRDWYKKAFNLKALTKKKRKKKTRQTRCPITETTTLKSLIARIPLANKPLVQLLNKKDLRNLLRY